MELRRYLHIIRQRWILIIVTTLVGAGVGLLTTSTKSEYRTSTVLYVGDRAISPNDVQLYALPGLNQILATYAEMLPNAVIAQQAIETTGVARSAGQAAAETKAQIVPSTSLITVTVTDRDPLVAQKLANGISNAFVQQVQTYEPTPAPGTVPTEPAYVFQDAPLPASPLPTGLTRKVLLGAVFGFILSILLVLLLDYLDITVRNPEDIELRLDLPVLGTVPFRRSMTAGGSYVPEKIGID